MNCGVGIRYQVGRRIWWSKRDKGASKQRDKWVKAKTWENTTDLWGMTNNSNSMDHMVHVGDEEEIKPEGQLLSLRHSFESQAKEFGHNVEDSGESMKVVQ